MSPNLHWLKKLHVENFKRFDVLDLEFSGLNILVGPNNSGKSTALQACALFNFCYQSCLEKRNGNYIFQNRTFGPDEFFAVPAAEPKDLWKNRRVQRGNEAIPIRLKAELYSGDIFEFEIVLRFNRFSVQSVSGQPISHTPSIILIPGYTDFWPREERRTLAVRREMRNQAQHGGIIRNLLLDLRDNSEHWDRFVNELAAIFPTIHLLRPAFDEQTDRYIRVGYTEEENTHDKTKRATPPELDLFSGGSGFRQFVQILASILVEDATTVLLDEPDAHLFSKLQSELFSTMKRLVESGIQIIAATHSTDLIAAANPSQLVTFANGKPRRLSVWPEVLNMVSTLGGLENLSLLLIDAYRKVIVVEDKSDEQYLRLWMSRILGSEHYKHIQARMVFLYAHGRPKGDDVTQMLDTLKQAYHSEKALDIKAFVIADRDYALEDTMNAEKQRYSASPFSNSQLWHIWERVEIENYLINPNAICSAVEQNKDERLPLFTPNNEQIIQIIEQAVEENRESMRLRMINVFSDKSKNERLGWQSSTITQKAEEFVNQVWQGTMRYTWCDAKEKVLPQIRQKIREAFSIQLSDSMVIEAIRDEEIPNDLCHLVNSLADFIGRTK
jgi:predicted ATPase